jgi:hypothetical protein
VLVGSDHHCVKHFLEWLGRTSPCYFARAFASHPKTEAPRIVTTVALDAFSRKDAADVARAFDAAAEKDWFGAVLFPRIRTGEELITALRTLTRAGRWSCEGVEWKTIARPGDRPVGLTWLTNTGLRSSAMGFAPLGSMPVPRRGPYFGIVVWPGGYRNKLMRSKRPGTVGFIDGAHGLKPAKYSDVFERTTKRVRVIFGDPKEDPVVLRDVGFCLPAVIADPFLNECAAHKDAPTARTPRARRGAPKASKRRG